MKKLALITTLAGLMTFALFAFMAFLINSDKVNLTTPLAHIPIDIVSLPEEKPPEVKPKPVLKPPVAPPIPRTTELPAINTGSNTLVYNPPKITLPDNGVGTFTLNNNANNEARPVVRVSPKYPLNAVRNGIEGWVVLAFTINAIGEVVDISIVKSEPKRIFDKAARQALKKWKYRAKKVNGIAVEQQNLSVQLDFTMDQSS